MNALLPKFLDVAMPWAVRHCWEPGQRYQDPGDPAETYSLWIFLEGEAHVSMGARQWSIHEGMACLWPPHCRRTIVTPGGAQWLSIRLRATLYGQIDLLQLLWPPAVWQPSVEEFSALRHISELLVTEWGGTTPFPAVAPTTIDLFLNHRFATWESRDTTSVLLSDSYARALVGLCWRMLGKIPLEEASHQIYPAWLSAALEQLRNNPDVSIEQLAREAGFSPTQFRRHFQKWFGTAPREYINRLRLEDARHLLENSDLSVNEIAERIGFLSTPHFNTVFKRAFGFPPAHYRRLSRQESPSPDAVE